MLVIERPKVPSAGEVLRDFNDGLSYIVIEVEGYEPEKYNTHPDWDRYKHVNMMCLTTGEPRRKMLRDLFFYEVLE